MSSPQGQPATAAPSTSGGKTLVAFALLAALSGGAVACSRASGDTEAHAKPPVVIEPTAVDVDPFILNLADPAGDRYFRLHLRLVLDQRVPAERAAEGLAQVKLRDRFLSLLSKKRASELTTVEGKETLRAELQALTEPLFAAAPFYDAEHDSAPAHVSDVLFTEFLVQ